MMIEMDDDGRCLPVRGYEGRYRVSCNGQVIGLGGRVMTPTIDRYGYVCVRLNKDGVQCHKKVHRLVCEAYNGPPPDPAYHAAHLDGDPLNNCASNIAWASPKENNGHKKLHGRANGGVTSRLSHDDVTTIRASLASTRSLARVYGVTQSHIVRIRNRKARRDVP